MGQRGSETTGMDVGHQDPPGTDRPQLVHHAVGAGPRAPSPAPRPSPRDAAATTVGLSMPGVSATASCDLLLGDVVVHHHVAAGHHHALEAAPEDVEARTASSPPRGDQHGLGLQDRLAEDLEPGLGAGCCRSRPRRRSRRPRRAGRWSRRRRRGGSRSASMPRSARYCRTIPTYDVAMRVPCELRGVVVPARPGRRSGSVLRPKPSPSTSSALAPESSSRSRPVMPTSRVPSPT